MHALGWHEADLARDVVHAGRVAALRSQQHEIDRAPRGSDDTAGAVGRAGTRATGRIASR
jgi:hypothetical protein